MLAGRFDGDGATEFDACVDKLDRTGGSWILDFSRVHYLSSMGLRSLIRADKRLRASHGALLLAALSPLVRQVLETARLHEHFRISASVPDALALARAASVAPDRAVQRMRHGRMYTLWPLGGRSMLETWGVPPAARPEQIAPDALATFALQDLECAIGLGGFGATRGEACEAIGAFLAARRFAGLRPSGTQCAADFVLPHEAGDALVHVASALGIAGSPATALRLSSADTIGLGDLVDDALALSQEESDLRSTAVAILALVELADLDRPAIMMLVAAEAPPHTPSGAGFDALRDWLRHPELLHGRLFAGRAVLLARSTSVPAIAADPADIIATIANIDSVEDVVEIDPVWRVRTALAWAYRPEGVREGRERLLTVDVDGGPPLPEEWESIARRLYRDCRRIILTPLYGGYMSSTFRVASYDAEGRRLLPTVLKIGPIALTAREEAANRKVRPDLHPEQQHDPPRRSGGGRMGWAPLQFPGHHGT